MRNKNMFLVLPNGSRMRPYVIASISITDTGVALTSSSDMLGFIEVEDLSKKKMVAELVQDCVTAGKDFEQPDWAALGLAG